MEEKDSKLIQAYLEGNLLGEELKKFENRLSKEKELAAELSLYQEVDLRLEELQKEELTNEWKKYLEENTSEIPPTRKLGSIYLASGIAASIILLLGIYWWVSKPIPAPLLASNYWEQTASFSYKDVDRSTTLTSAESELLKEAYTNFESKNHQSSLSILDSITSINEETLLLTGANYFLLEDYENAQKSFQMILEEPNYLAKDEASWYLVLTLLKQDSIAPAKTILTEIIEDKSWNHSFAKDLLDQL